MESLRRDWLTLVGEVDAWAQSAVPGDADFAVTLANGRTVTVVMSPDDLDDMYVAFGDLSEIADYVINSLEAMSTELGFLVYRQYDLEPSTDRALPLEPEWPKITGGKWYAHDPRTGRQTPFNRDDDPEH